MFERVAVFVSAFFAIIARRVIFASCGQPEGDEMLTSDVLPLIREAANRVYSVVHETPLVPLPRRPESPNPGMAYAKFEQLQTTGSFKLRGATNKLLSLTPPEAAAGVITSSTGNHGLGVAASAMIRSPPRWRRGKRRCNRASPPQIWVSKLDATTSISVGPS
jgi:hypothetical protein